MTIEELEFVNFCIFMLAEKMNKSTTEIYKLLTKDTNLINDYLKPCYDILHTQGKEYIVSEIIEALKERGVTI